MPVHSLAQRRAWSEFLEALVGRYGPAGTFWELHPELPQGPDPDLADLERGERSPLRRGFGSAPTSALLRGSAPAIRSVDPDAQILLGGLYATPRIEPALDATTFLNRLYRHRGIKGLFDGVALHPYAAQTRALMAADIAPCER